jgi:hypothetical protein
VKTIETHYLRYGNGMLTVFYDGPESQLEFTSAAESGNDLRLTDDEETSLIWLVNSYTAGYPLDLEERPEVLWWDRFITYILRNVTIGSDEFRKSRAGLISADLMRYIREHSGLSPSDFREMSLADVFSEIQRLVEIRKSANTQAGGDHNKKALPENLPEADVTKARDAAAEDPPEQHEWHPDYFTVSELAAMRKAVKLPYRSSTMTREIDEEIIAKRIKRKGKKPMRIRMDLYTEWNSKHDG